MLDEAMATDVAEQLGERKATHLGSQVDQYRAQIDHLTERAAGATQQLTQNLRRMAEQRDLLKLAQAAAEDSSYADHLVEEWTDLRENPRLVHADMVGNVLTLTTADDIRLHRDDSPETRWLGAFKIGLNLENGQITLTNLDTRRGGRDHPHVINGSPCFGGDSHVFAELMASGSLNLLFEMLLQYLEKLNLADEYGAYGAYWFEQEDVRPEGAPRPPRPMSVPQFAMQHGPGSEFLDQEGRRGRVLRVTNQHQCAIEWLDDNIEEARGMHLLVTGAPEPVAI